MNSELKLMDSLGNDEYVKNYFQESYKLITDIKNVQIFWIRNTVLEIADKIYINEERKIDYLRRMKDGEYIYVISNNEYLRCSKVGDRIVVMMVGKGDDNNLHYCMFNYQLDMDYEQVANDEFSNVARNLFLQLLIFINFSEIDVKIVNNNSKTTGNRDNKIVNNSEFQLNIVDTSWNTIIQRTEGFDVRGHLRLQACGEGHKDRKLIWINQFQKHGYTRTAKISKEDS